MHLLRALRPKDAGRNANQTGVSTLGLRSQLDRGYNPAITHHPPTPSLNKSKGGGENADSYD